MRLGIHFMNFDVTGAPGSLPSALAAAARAADDGGCSAFSLPDHWFQMDELGGPHMPMLEGYAALGFLAGKTRRLKLGLLVTGVSYRHPGLLAKIVSTLDVLSGGRAQLGIGAGWYEREHVGLGVRFPPRAERYERLEETLQICRQMWSDDNGAYNGNHYRLAETICEPRPIQRPGPPILVGGSGERKTLRLVARYADACNLYGTSPSDVAHKLDVLARHCEAEERDYSRIEKTIILPRTDPLDDPDEFVATMGEYATLGIEQAWVSPVGPDPAAWVAEVSERIVPRLGR